MAKKSGGNKGGGKAVKTGRDAGTGKFKSVPAARRDKEGSVVETNKRGGKGGKKGKK